MLADVRVLVIAIDTLLAGWVVFHVCWSSL